MKNIDDYREYFQSEESAIEYDEESYDADTYAAILWEIEQSVLISQILRMEENKQRIRYLDFACGTGRIVSLLEQYVDKSCGIDISPFMIEQARKKINKTSLFVGDLTTDGFLIDGTFELITVFRFVLNAQIELRDRALRILSGRLTDENSILIFNIHTNKYSYAFLSYIFHKLFGSSANGDEKKYLSLWEGKKIAKRANLEVIKVNGLGFVSGKFYRIFPRTLLLAIEAQLARIPLINCLGTDLIFICKKSD